MTKLSRRSVLLGVCAFATAPAFATGDWPARRITLMHGFPPGGPVDVLARILSDPLSRALGQPVVVESKPGATGTMAAGIAARAAPDGYTLLALPGTYTATSAMFLNLPYDPTEDFTFISMTAESPLVLVAGADSTLHTVADVVSAARSSSTPLRYGTAGVGSIQHLTMELFAKAAKITLQHVPYKGGMPAITDLLGKRIDLVIDPPTALLQFVKDGRLRALAVTSEDRFWGLPEVATMGEAGFSGFVVTPCQGIVAPAHLPADIAAKINKAAAVALADPATTEKLRAIGATAHPSSPEDYKARIVTDIARWRAVIDQAHVARI